MTLVRSIRWTLCIPTLLASSCSPGITEPVVALLPAVLEFDGRPVDIPTPATASVGMPITVTFRSAGGGCTRTGPTTASVQGLVAVIEPFDSVVTKLPPNWGCPMILRALEHTATVRFAAPGTATIQVVGRRADDAALVIERTVVIQ
jgi:hypothetical protein